MPYIANYLGWKSFVAFGGLIGNHVKSFSIIILLAITLLCEYGQHATVNVLSELQLSSTTVKLQQFVIYSKYLWCVH